MYTNNRDAYRQTFYTVWQKHKKNLSLEGVESEILNVVLHHPEYHPLLESVSQDEFLPEENPFLHMSLHLAIREQIRMDRPSGIAEIYLQLCKQADNSHNIEHQMMTCLATMLWEAQKTGEMVSDEVYLKALKEITLSHTGRR